MALSYYDDLRSRSWVGFAEVAILAPELLTMQRRERSVSESKVSPEASLEIS